MKVSAILLGFGSRSPADGSGPGTPHEYPSSYATGLGATVNGLYRHACRVGYRGKYPPTR